MMMQSEYWIGMAHHLGSVACCLTLFLTEAEGFGATTPASFRSRRTGSTE